MKSFKQKGNVVRLWSSKVNFEAGGGGEVAKTEDKLNEGLITLV